MSNSPLKHLHEDALMQIGQLLGAEVLASHSLSSDATRIDLDNGQRIVVKIVSRQSSEGWKPGNPWTELVATDILSAEGAPVPKLIAADLEHGWMATSFIEGMSLGDIPASHKFSAFSSLIRDLSHIEATTSLYWSDMKKFGHVEPDPSKRVQKLFDQVRLLLQPHAAIAWDHLIEESKMHTAFLNRDVGAESGIRPGPLDVHAGNVLWIQKENRLSTIFFDMATVGHGWTEQRVSAYAQSVIPAVSSLLTPESYDWYVKEKGSEAGLRLFVFDLTFWAIALSRVDAGLNASQTSAGRAVHTTWGDPKYLAEPCLRMWYRNRGDDRRVRAIQNGLLPHFVDRLVDGRKRDGV